ncbi:hypothetical protein ID866_10834 [Astraeus odoratus]|nr:hypothetical protein ID866_10834 [Astraeus odoratus]
MNGSKWNEIRARSGYQKMHEICKQAQENGWAWLWVETCRINKQSSSELSETLDSIYQWYADSGRSHAYTQT